MKQLEYCNHADRVVIKLLVNAILHKGYSITVFDGEEHALTGCCDKAKIFEALTSTGEDHIILEAKDGLREGWFHLIYDNGSEDEPLVVISDHTDNAICNLIYASVEAELEHYELRWVKKGSKL